MRWDGGLLRDERVEGRVIERSEGMREKEEMLGHWERKTECLFEEGGQGEEKGNAKNEGLRPSSPGCPWGTHATEGAFRFGDSAPNSAKFSFLNKI